MIDRESVAAVLASTWAGEDEAMYRALTGESTLSDLQYRNWTAPMKATTGRICLRVDTPDGPTWVRWAPSEQFRGVEPPDYDDETVVSRTRLRQWLVRHAVRPVLIEDTPFGGAPADGSEPRRVIDDFSR